MTRSPHHPTDAQIEEGGAAAIDRHDGAGHEGGVVRGEEGDRGRDLAHVRLAAERLQRRGRFAGGRFAAAASGVMRVRR